MQRFVKGVDIKRQIVLSLLEHKVVKNSTPRKLAYTLRIAKFQINAIKFERTQIHLFSDVSTAVVVLGA